MKQTKSAARPGRSRPRTHAPACRRRPSPIIRRPTPRTGIRVGVSASRGGFTLIEIMIVVAIIGLLAGVAIPNYLEARRTTQMRTCIINLQNIEGAVERWAMEANKGPDQTVTLKDIGPYLKHRIYCPAGGTSFEDSYQLTRIEEPPACLRSPEGKYPHKLPL